jgi:hypothetical protein
MQTRVPMMPMPAFPSTTGWSPAPTTYTNKTTIVLTGANMTVNGAPVAWPASGLIYVTGGACSGYNPENPAAGAATCGDVVIKGSYSQSLTVFAQNDIVINGSLTRSAGSDAVLGLVAANWVRVDHAASSSPPTYAAGNGRCTPTTATVAAGMNPLTIQASLLAINHSFVVDNWACTNSSASQPSLTVTGSVAGKYHPVTAPPWAGNFGYADSIAYDPRLSYHQPPRFPQPAGGLWRPVRTTEQSPPPSGL